MKKNRLVLIMAILNLSGFLIMIAINSLTNTLPINEITTGEVSALYPNLFVPAGITFGIWGLIYLCLGVTVIYQLLHTIRSGGSSVISQIGPFFFISCLANTGWIFAWHHQKLFVSLITMLVLLGCLIAIYLRLGIGLSTVFRMQKYLVHVPFSIYLGWITIATIANITVLLVDNNWNGFGLSDVFWTIAVITTGVLISMIVLIQRRDTFFNLVIFWALLGIVVERVNATGEPVQSLVVAAVIGLFVIGGGVIYNYTS